MSREDRSASVLVLPQGRCGPGPALADPHERTPDLAHSHPPVSELLWSPRPDHLLSSGDRAVVATTREGLAQLTRGAERAGEGATF